MKKNYLLFACILAFLPCIKPLAYDCEVDGIYYNRLSTDEFEVTYGTNKYTGDIVIPEIVEYREKQFKVVQIGSNAFKNCTSLASVTIPQGVTSLPDDAFSGCTSLTSVSIPQSVSTVGVRAFYNCHSLASVEIPAAVTTISDYLFYGCSKLASVTLPQGITSIGEYAFSDCSSLGSLTLPTQIASIAQYTFQNCTGLTALGLPEGLQTIGLSAFYNCSRLEVVSIPKTLTSIGKNAYYNCTSLKKVIIKDMSAWCKIAFASAESNPLHYAQRLYSDENTEIKDFYIPQNVTRIGNYAFYNAEYLSRIYIMNSTPPSIGANTFGNTCYTWTDVYVPKGAKENYQNASYWSNFKAIAEHEYDYNNIKINGINYRSSSYYSSNVEVIKNEDAPYSGDISLPETITFLGKVYNVTAIGANAFQNCTGLTSITIPASVKEIGNDAFKDCTGLTKVIVPDIAAWCRILFKGESNGSWSWSYANPLRYAHHLYNDNDTEIKNLIIPNEVTYISEHAFGNCSYIESVAIPNSVKSIGEAAFQGCTSLTSITIPNSVTQISKYAFSDCSSLETVTLSENITRINDNLFYYCTSLKNITIPQSVTYIAYQSFYNCKSLTTITIPQNVSYIGYTAFCSCDKLSTVVSLCEIPPTLGKSYGSEIVFDYSKQAYLLVPQGCKENYLNYGQDSMNKRWGTYSFSGIFEFEPNKGEYLVLYSSLGGKIVYEGQEISDGAELYTVSNSKTISLKIIADDGYELSACKIDGDSIKEITRESDNTYSITLNADRGHHVDAYFALKMYEGRIISSYSNNRYLYYRVLPNKELEVCRGYNSHDAMYYYIGGNVVIPDSVVFPATLSSPQQEYKVTSIDKYTFRDDYGNYNRDQPLLSVVVGNNITSINDRTFYDCENLTSVTLGNKVKNIGDEAFFGCNNISSLKVESGNTVYDSRNNCNAIIETSTNTLIMGCKTSIVPNGVTSIGNYAFNNCEGLTEITIPNSVTSIGNYAFNYCPGLTEITIPNSVTSIGTRAFSYCENLRNIIIHNGITQIMNNTFECCTNLTNISLPNGITKIGSSAFRNCVSLSSITIPKSVTSIGNRAFFDCTSLSEVVSLNPTPPTISSNTFTEYTATLQVPISSKEAYQNAEYWKNFTNIVEIDPSGIQTITLDKDINAPVYDLNGRKLKEPIRGINIIKGKKLMVK